MQRPSLALTEGNFLYFHCCPTLWSVVTKINFLFFIAASLNHAHFDGPYTDNGDLRHIVVRETDLRHLVVRDGGVFRHLDVRGGEDAATSAIKMAETSAM